jgi:virginiamycin B lyase
MANVRMSGVSAAADGTLWGVDSTGFVYMLQQQPWQWKRNPTAKRVKEIAVGSQGHVWCRNMDGHIFQLETPAWDANWLQDVGASDVQSISAGADGTVWVGNSQGQLFMRTAGGYIEQGATGGNVSAALVERYNRDGGHWAQNPHARNAEEVTVGDAGHVWYRDSAGKVHQLIGRTANGRWTADSQASHVQFISAASDGTVWVSSADPADKDRLFRRTGANKWHKDANGKAIQGSAGAADKFYCVNAEGVIYKQSGSDWLVVYGPDLSKTRARTHLVQQHETLGSIVQQTYKVSGPALTAKIKEVAAFNGIANPDRIDAGDEIVLP